MYDFFVIDGKKLIDYKPGYEQYSRAFIKVEEEFAEKRKDMANVSLTEMKRLYPDLFIRNLYLFIKYLPFAYERMQKIGMDEATIQSFWLLIESVNERIGCLAPREFISMFPITKEYDGEKYSTKDYFYTMQVINQMPAQPIGSENVSEFLFGYCNRDIEPYMVAWMGIVNRMHKLNGGKDITLEFFEDMGIPVHTYHEEAGFMVDDEFGEIRTVQLNNETYFVGKDVARALGYGEGKSLNNAISNHVAEEDKGVTEIVTPGGKQGMTIINESGLYALIFGSKLESAKKFKHWVTSEVLPTLRKTGSYEMPKPKKVRIESLSAANTTVKTLTPILEAAGCNSQIVLLTAKAIYEKAGLALPIEIKADQQYFDTVHIARKVGIYYQSSGKPADKAVNEIIRRLNISEDMYTETWESKGQWQGTVRKYAAPVIGMVEKWYADNGYPRNIEYEQTNGQKKTYHVIWRKSEVA